MDYIGGAKELADKAGLDKDGNAASAEVTVPDLDGIIEFAKTANKRREEEVEGITDPALKASVWEFVKLP